MKRLNLISTLLIFYFAGLLVQAQEEKEFNYLFSPGNHSFSGFGGPLVQFGKAEGSFAVYSGGGGALLIDQKFFIGGYGMGLATRHLRKDIMLYGTHYDKLRTSFGHGGFWLGYIDHSAEMLHFGFSTKIGWGELALYDEQFDFSQQDYLTQDPVFVLTPQIEAEVNLTRWFKINAAIGYQLVTEVNGYKFSDTGGDVFRAKDYSTPQLSLGLLFGGFAAN